MPDPSADGGADRREAAMRKILVIGIGAGDPDHMTVQAIEALNRADVIIIPDKGSEKAALRALRLEICARFLRGDGHRFVDIAMPVRAASGPYRDGVDDWHAAIAGEYRRRFETELSEQETGALLVWGDPSLYDSTLRILERIEASGLALDYEVFPGISSVQALAARHRIPLNRIGEPVLLTTGRQLAARPDGIDSIVMLDGEQAFASIDGQGLELFWGAYLGMADEVLMSGPLEAIAAAVRERRAQLRAEKGWIMDVYLLRHSEP